MASDWLIWQLADSGFPAGGFVHSWGLEAARQAGAVQDASDLRRFLEEILWQAGFAGLPLVNAAYANPDRIEEIDSLCDAFLLNHVANRASRMQGRAFLSTCEKSFQNRGIRKISELAREKEIHRHYAPLFGALAQSLDLDFESTRRLFLYLTLRGVLSAAVRLAIIGPHQAQALQADLAPTLNKVLAQSADLGPNDLAQTAPLVDLMQASHDRLYSRLFQS